MERTWERSDLGGWIMTILVLALVGFLIWYSYLRPEPQPSYEELVVSIAFSESCEALTASHDSALLAHEAEAIDDQQMNTIWGSVLDRAEVLIPDGDLTAHLRCTGLIGRCPRGTPADICANLLSEN